MKNAHHDPMPLGEILIRRGQIRRYQLDFLLELQKSYKRARRDFRLGDLLLRHRLLSTDTLNEALDVQTTMPDEGLTAIIKRIESEPSQLTRHLTAEPAY